ncbi:autotransporter [Pantoea phytobeneficialis]|uniref:Autotransporter n=1 Tax=Pantoea phytobeneficialis TaxID=2052056 RepID=A0AAP9H1Q5_9GAMM|nr:autotransporter [Pantoea phytobeneficialis]MDO6408271.1 autotransporter [Pantoea phytobeneficialis]QGR04922.1 autotransporter [Pantoea phytobeneficialis]
MLQKSQRSGQHNLALVMGCAWLFAVSCPVLAWDENSQGQSVASPDYNAILAEKISQNHLMLTENSTNNLMDAALNAPGEAVVSVHTEAASVGANPFTHRMSAGWQLPVNETLTTGPVAQYAVDSSPLSCPQCEFVEPDKDDHIASLGWRVDSSLGWIAPYAQISYSHQLGEMNFTPRSDGGIARENNWMDVSVGANMPLGQHLSAFASFSQNGAMSSGEQFIYSLGVSASF